MTTTSPSPAAPPTSGATEILQVRGVQKIYHGRNRNIEAMRDLTFSVSAGEFACIVGPSGAGKTTLLKCIAGLLDVTAGEILLEGELVTEPPGGMAVVFQEYGRSLFPWLTVRQNVELPLKEKRIPKAERERLVKESLEAVGLTDVSGAHPFQLSGGMQQRVAIARAVAYEPHILLMDEPFAAVDAQTRGELEDLVLSLWKRLGVTVLLVTHDIDEAVYLGQRVIVLSMSPTVVLANIPISLPEDRNQLHTRSLPRFGELRGEVYELIQQAKRGVRPDR